MPFKSQAQRRWMYANNPEMAEKWEDETPKGKKLPKKLKKKEEGGELPKAQLGEMLSFNKYARKDLRPKAKPLPPGMLNLEQLKLLDPNALKSQMVPRTDNVPAGPVNIPRRNQVTLDDIKANNKTRLAIDKGIIRDRQAIKDRIAKSNATGRPEDSAAGDKFRFFPEDPNSFIDNWINPLKMIGDMADNLGRASDSDNDMSVGQRLLAVGMPLGVGALGQIGAKSTGQWANNITNPLAGIGPEIIKPGEAKEFMSALNSRFGRKKGMQDVTLLPDEQELLHTVRNIGSVKQGSPNILRDEKALETVMKRANKLSDEQFQNLTGMKKSQIAERLELLKNRGTKKINEGPVTDAERAQYPPQLARNSVYSDAYEAMSPGARNDAKQFFEDEGYIGGTPYGSPHRAEISDAFRGANAAHAAREEENAVISSIRQREEMLANPAPPRNSDNIMDEFDRAEFANLSPEARNELKAYYNSRGNTHVNRRASPYVDDIDAAYSRSNAARNRAENEALDAELAAAQRRLADRDAANAARDAQIRNERATRDEQIANQRGERAIVTEDEEAILDAIDDPDWLPEGTQQVARNNVDVNTGLELDWTSPNPGSEVVQRRLAERQAQMESTGAHTSDFEDLDAIPDTGDLADDFANETMPMAESADDIIYNADGSINWDAERARIRRQGVNEGDTDAALDDMAELSNDQLPPPPAELHIPEEGSWEAELARGQRAQADLEYTIGSQANAVRAREVLAAAEARRDALRAREAAENLPRLEDLDYADRVRFQQIARDYQAANPGVDQSVIMDFTRRDFAQRRALAGNPIPEQTGTLQGWQQRPITEATNANYLTSNVDLKPVPNMPTLKLRGEDGSSVMGRINKRLSREEPILQQSQWPTGSRALKPSLYKDGSNNPAREIMSAYKEVRAANKGETLYPAGSLSTDSLPISLAMTEKAIKEDIIDLGFHGYQTINSSGFGTKAGLDPKLQLKEINSYISRINKDYKGKKLPMAKISQYGEIEFPTFSVTRKQFGGTMQPGGKYDPFGVQGIMGQFTPAQSCPPGSHFDVTQNKCIPMNKFPYGTQGPYDPTDPRTNLTSPPYADQWHRGEGEGDFFNNLDSNHPDSTSDRQSNYSDNTTNMPADKKKKLNPFMALRGFTTAASWLGNKIERGRQDRYRMEQEAQLGQNNYMPANDFQPMYNNQYFQIGGAVNPGFFDPYVSMRERPKPSMEFVTDTPQMRQAYPEYYERTMSNGNYGKYNGITDKNGRFSAWDAFKTNRNYFFENASDQFPSPSNVYRPENQHIVDNSLEREILPIAMKGGWMKKMRGKKK